MIDSIFLSPTESAVRIRWYIYLRWFILLAIILPGLVSLYLVEGASDKVLYNAMIGVAALAMNALFYGLSVMLKNTKLIKGFISTIFIIDIALITYFIYTKGGIESRSVIMYVIPIIMSAAIFGRKGVYSLALLSMLSYDALIISNYFGFFPSVNAFDLHLQTDVGYVINTVIFFNVLFVLISLAVDFIARLLNRKEQLATQRLNDLIRAQAIAKFGSWEWQKDEDVVTWSDELYHIFGVEKTTQAITFEQYLSYIHPDDKELLLSEIGNATQQEMEFSFDHRIIHPNGTVRYVYSSGQSFADKNGSVTHMVGTARDVTEAKLLETAKNDFVAVTSHQLRTPATIVKQYTKMLTDGYAGNVTDAQRKFLNTIYDSNERQIAIINDLLNIARIDSGNFTINPKRTDLVVMLQQIKTEHAGKYKAKKQRLVFKPTYKQVYCDIDSDQIKMAIENLLDNAHKYTPKNRSVKIELKRKRDFALVMITDEGIGIPAKDMHKIFDMFSRVDNPSVLQEEGTGIGLYWAKKIVTMHNGAISVVSEHTKGTTFSIELPYRVS
jgi:PAS domain S-box-containing protein